MTDKNEYTVIDNKYLKYEEKFFNMLSDPAGFIISNPENFYEVPLYNLFFPEELVLAQIQNLFHFILQSFLNSELIKPDDLADGSYVFTERINLAKIYELLLLRNTFNTQPFFKLRVLLESANAKNRISELELAEILSTFYSGLSEASEDMTVTKVSVDCDSIPLFNSDDYNNEPELKKSLSLLTDYIDSSKQYLHSFMMHGSLATLDYIYRSSDCDTLLILNKTTACSAQALLEVKEKVRNIRSVFLTIDPLQHHGAYIYTQQDMDFFPQSWLPLVLMDYSRLIYAENNSLEYKIRPSIIERRSEIWNITYGMRHEWITNNYPRNLTDYKQHLQVVLLMPVFYYQMHGAFVYKKHIFNMLRSEVPASAYKIIDEATKLRNNSLYLKEENKTGRIIDGTDEIPEWLKRETYPDMLYRSAELIELLFERVHDKFICEEDLWEDELLHLPQCAGGFGDLWAKNISERLGDTTITVNNVDKPLVSVNKKEYALTDLPIYFQEKFYNEVKINFTKNICDAGGIKSIYQMGSVSAPGLSDIDFIVVIDDSFNKDNLTACMNAFYSLNAEAKYVIKHPPSAFINAELLEKITWIHPTFDLINLYGNNVLNKKPEQAPAVNQLINLVDLFLMEFPAEFLEDLQKKEIPVRNHLMRMKSLSLSAKIMELNGIKLPEDVQAFINSVLSIYKNWFSNSEEESLKQFTAIAGASEDTIYKFVFLLKEHLIKAGFNIECPDRIAGIYAGKTFFINDWSIDTAKYLSARLLEQYGYVCSVLPSEFLIGIINYSNGNNELAERIKKFFWLNSKASAAPFKGIEQRIKYLSLHYALLKEHNLPGGLFYPYHFCPEYWNPDFITFKWHKAIDEEMDRKAVFSENFAAVSISKWNELIVIPAEIEKDKANTVTVAYAGGFYKMEQGVRWISKNASMFVFSNYHLELSFDLTNLSASYYTKFPLEIDIFVDNTKVHHTVFIDSHQTNKIVLTLEEAKPEYEIRIESSSCFVPKDAGINNDERKLSVFMSGLKITVLDNHPENSDLLLRAEEFINHKEFDEARVLLTSILQTDEKNTDALNDLAVICIMENKFDDALALIELILSIDPSNDVAKENLSIIKPDCEVIEPSDKPDESNNMSGSRLIIESESLIELKQYAKARILLEDILKTNPENIDALNNLGITELLTNNLNKASACFSKILSLDPDNETAKGNIEYLLNLTDQRINNINTSDYINALLLEANDLVAQQIDFKSFVEFTDQLFCDIRPKLQILLNNDQNTELFIAKISNLLIAKYQYIRRHTTLLSKPFGILIDTANGCNLHCPGCIHTSGENTGIKWDKAILSDETYRKIIECYGPYATHILFYNYGEPLINKRTAHFIKIAKEYGIFTSVSTNLSLNIDADEIVNSGLDYLILSIDGASKNTYNKYRRGGNFETVLENIDKLVKAKIKHNKSTPYIVWQYLIFEHNKHEIDHAEKTANEIGVDELHLAVPFDVSAYAPEIKIAADAINLSRRIPFYRNRNSDNLSDTNKNDAAGLSIFKHKNWLLKLTDIGNVHFRTEIRKELYTCQWLYKSIVFDANGYVMPCCSAPTESKNLIFSNSLLKDCTTDNLFNSNMYLLAREAFSNNAGYKDKITKLAAADIPYCEACGGNNESINVGSKQLLQYLLSNNLFKIISEENKIKLAEW